MTFDKRIAYLILTHDQPNHLKRLVSSLDIPKAQFFIHVDRKQNIDSFKQGLEQPNVCFIGDRIRVNHGGFSLTEAMLRLLKVAHQISTVDNYLFLSGRDYPIKSNAVIVDCLDTHRLTNFISFYPLVENAHFITNIQKYSFIDAKGYIPKPFNRLVTPFQKAVDRLLPNRTFFKHLIPYRGSQWCCLTSETVNYILSYLKTTEGKRLCNFYRYTWGADEMLLHTIVLNSPFAKDCRFFDRDGVSQASLLPDENKAYLHYVDWNSERENPAVLVDRDFDSLKASEFLFARKFCEQRSKGLLDRIDQELRNS